MFIPTLLVATLMIVSPLRAQDIVGLEDCGQAKGVDKKIGCLQSNVEFLHRLLKKNDAAVQTKLREEAAKLAVATAKIDELRDELNRLKAILDQFENRLPKK